MNATPEQQAIIQHVLTTNGLTMVSAVAGSGKTTLLVALANRMAEGNPAPGLYLAYNKSVAMEAQTKFPDFISCMTTHSLAYTPTVRAKGSKLHLGKFTYRQIHESIDYDFKCEIVDHIRTFCLSSFLNIDDYGKFHDLTPRLLEYLHKYLDQMLEGKTECTHDFYLKLYHIMLANGNISYEPFSIIALDESGDLNPVTLEIFKLLPAEKKVMVGDPHQNIYQFNHTINCFSVMADQGTYLPMTKSFRVDHRIAKRIQKYCQAYLSEDMLFEGIEITNPKVETRAFISRTNSALVRKLMELNKLHIPYGTIRDVKDIFALPLTLCALKPGGFTSNSEFKYLQDDANTYGKSKELQDRYKTVLMYLKDLHEGDLALQQAISIIFQYGKADVIACHEQAKKHSKKEQNYMIGTVHSCKGLEFDSVELADDMNQSIAGIVLSMKLDPDYILTTEERAELNLYYVGASRAKKELHNAKYL